MTHILLTESHGTANRLSALRRAYTDRLVERYQEIEDALTEFTAAGDAASLDRLGDLAHQLRGSAASYGHAEIGRLAEKLERAGTDSTDHGVTSKMLWRVMGLLRRAIREVTVAAPATVGLNSGASTAPGALTLQLLEDDVDLADLLTEQLRPFGYNVVAHRTADPFLEAIHREPPAAILLDLSLEDGVRGTEVAQRIPEELKEYVPLVFLSVDADFESRIEATRAGAKAYLEKPVDIDELAELLDRLVRQEDSEALRVLVVEDSAETASLHAGALDAAGMVTRIARDARDAMDQIARFRPEIILMDLYMPEIRGDEMAQVLRQQPAFDSIPIVFVSAETDERVQISALQRGGDDFLTKPVDLNALTSSIRIRAERYRLLQASMQRDSLTGLLNHRFAKEALEAELARAHRMGSPLSVAMLDIDHFKSVNDSWGHPAGDLVIRSLARILTQRLRRSDVVGRYGGEEFIVVMPDTPVERAARVLDELRSSFSTIVHLARETRFTCSMSCGVVEARNDERGDDCLSRADAALYQAKNAGRDRVVSG